MQKEKEMKKDKLTYYQQMQHPLWQKKRLEVMELHDFKCQVCGASDTQLNVHHPIYKRGAMIWDYRNIELECLCETCHLQSHAIDEHIKKIIQDGVRCYGEGFKSVIMGYVHCKLGEAPIQDYESKQFYLHGYTDAKKTAKKLATMSKLHETK